MNNTYKMISSDNFNEDIKIMVMDLFEIIDHHLFLYNKSINSEEGIDRIIKDTNLDKDTVMKVSKDFRDKYSIDKLLSGEQKLHINSFFERANLSEHKATRSFDSLINILNKFLKMNNEIEIKDSLDFLYIDDVIDSFDNVDLNSNDKKTFLVKISNDIENYTLMNIQNKKIFITQPKDNLIVATRNKQYYICINSLWSKYNIGGENVDG